MKETLQIIGPISQMPDKNFEAFNKVALHYSKLGYHVIEPHALAVGLALSKEDATPVTEKEIISECIRSILTKVDKVVMLEGIELSNGAPIELLICATYGIPIIEAYTNKPLYVGANISVTYVDGGMVSWGLDPDNLSAQ